MRISDFDASTVATSPNDLPGRGSSYSKLLSYRTGFSTLTEVGHGY